jgi:hypothetical protein
MLYTLLFSVYPDTSARFQVDSLRGVEKNSLPLNFERVCYILNNMLRTYPVEATTSINK